MESPLFDSFIAISVPIVSETIFRKKFLRLKMINNELLNS